MSLHLCETSVWDTAQSGVGAQRISGLVKINIYASQVEVYTNAMKAGAE
jgi:hypothetical protein